MAKQGKVTMAVQVIVDDSGSMNVISGRVVKGLNQFLSQLGAAVTPVSVDITLFATSLGRTLVNNVPIYEIPKIKPSAYNPSNGYEDIALCVIQGLERLAKVDAFQHVLVVITDGLNRSSSMDRARAEIAKRMREGWLVLWLGADQAHGYNKAQMMQYAKNLGIPEGLTFAFDANNFDKVMPLAAQAALRFSGAGDQKAGEFTDEERAVA